MTITRTVGHAPRTAQVALRIGMIRDCIGCEDCRGLCAALIEALAVPDAVLHRRAP